jgi:hypothetical protein
LGATKTLTAFNHQKRGMLRHATVSTLLCDIERSGD